MDDKEYLELYSKKCLRCSYLIQEEGMKEHTCHYTNGNVECPAQEVQIILGGKIRRAVKLIRQARSQLDPKKEAQILEEISKEGPAKVKRLYDQLG